MSDEVTEPRKRNWFLRHKVATGVVVGLGIIGAVSGGSHSGGTKNAGAALPAAPSQAASAPDPVTPTKTYSPPPRPVPQPAVDLTEKSCSYVLGDFTEGTSHGYRFISRADVENTGNVGAVVRVTASWVQVGSDDVKMSRVIKLPYGFTRTLNYTMRVGSQQIDQIQAYSGLDNCDVTVKVLRSYGPAYAR